MTDIVETFFRSDKNVEPDIFWCWIILEFNIDNIFYEFLSKDLSLKKLGDVWYTTKYFKEFFLELYVG